MSTKIQYLKKASSVIALFAMIVFGFTPSASEASVSFQGMPQPIVSVSNYTQNPNTVSWSNSLNANPGDEVTAMIYFQNMGSTPAENVRIRLTPQNSGASTTHTFQASIMSSNGSTSSGSATVYLSQPQTLNFMGGSNSVKLYNTFGSYTYPPNGSDIFGSQGLYLGTVYPGVGTNSSQGAAVIRFTVGQTVTPPPTTYSAPNVTTHTPTFVTQNTAGFSGNYSISGTVGSVNSWFEFQSNSFGGTNQGNNPSNTFQYTKQNLSAGVSYSYRACASNQGVQACGAWVSFVTQTAQQPPQPPAQIPPQVTTNSPSVGTTNATLSGSLVSSGSSASTRWFEWGQTTSLGTIVSIAGTQNQSGSFSSQISGLQSGVTYYYKACASNSAGQVCGSIIPFSTQFVQPPQVILPTVTTNQPSSVSQTNAILSGALQSPVSGNVTRWFEWGTTPNPTTVVNVPGSTNQAGNFSASLSGLQSGVTYYYKACGSNSAGQNCGSVIPFSTQMVQPPAQIPPQVTTNSPSVGTTNATLSGSLVSSGSSASTRWFEWGQTTSLGTIVSIAGTQNQSGSFSSQISGLQSGVTYYYKACASNSAGQVCGSIIPFSTNQGQQQAFLPVVSTYYPSNIGVDWATFEGNINSTGNDSVTRWFEWGTSQNNLNRTLNVSGSQSYTGQFSRTANNLDDDETHYYKACASNSAGVACGNIVSFSTNSQEEDEDDEPTISTYPATSVSYTSATLEGYVNNTGGDSVTRWFEWGTSQNNLNRTLNVSGSQSTTGDFSRSLTGLESNRVYYYKACGSNNEGEDCGSVYSFVTDMQQQIVPNAQLPQVTTLYPGGISTNSATITGASTTQGSLASVWFEYGPTQGLGFVTPVMSQNQNTTITHNAPIINLVANTTYYYRIVAQNSAGRIEGATLSFRTTPLVATPIFTPNPVTPTPVTTTTIFQSTGSSAYIRLTIENGSDVVNAGAISAYQIEWENISNTILNNSVLRVILPQEVTYLGTTTGTYNENEHAITVNLGTLRPDDEGRFTVTTQAKTTGTSGDTIVAQVMMAFTTPGEAQHTAMNYDDDIYYNTVVLGTGASLFGLTFLPNTLLGWLLLLLILLLLIWAARLLMKRERQQHYVRQTPPPSSGLPMA